MLEKIGLPAKPSLRGNTWVVDASHCQGCSSQFTFINRKHHCRRCGGIFCGSCTSQRMVLRGQGDSPVRICDPCKKLEEAARYEMRYGYKNRAGRGNSRQTTKDDNELLSQILGNVEKGSPSRGQESNIGVESSIQRASSSSSCSNAQEISKSDGGSQSDISVDEHSREVQNEIGASSPEELRQRALDEKKKYKILKGEGKPEEALKAFKRGKELERQADALEIYLRKNRKKVSSSTSMGSNMSKDGHKESIRKSKLVSHVGKEKDDLAAELRELGWSDMDIRDDEKKTANITLEGEFSNILGEVAEKTGKRKVTSNVDKSEVVAHKKRALTLKREGKLAEAKEELKKAKILEKQLEEQELLAGAEDSDDELSALIRSMENETQDDLSSGFDHGPAFNFNHMLDIDDNMLDTNFEVTDDDMEDPEITAALKSFGWTDDSPSLKDMMPQSVPVDKEALSNEILSLKKQALNLKRSGNVADAMSYLKRAKLLERDLENLDSHETNRVAQTPSAMHKVLDAEVPRNSSNKMTIQKQLLGLKKNILSLKRDGRLDEAEEELKKCRVLEAQLKEMDGGSKLKPANASKEPSFVYEHVTSEDSLVGDDEVTDQDIHDPTYLSILSELGWKDEEQEPIGASAQRAPSHTSRSKAEIQKELLGLKRKALALRRQGKTEEADEVLKMAKSLESQMVEMENQKIESKVDSKRHKDSIVKSNASLMEADDEVDVTEKDMHDPALMSLLKGLGWEDEKHETVSLKNGPDLPVLQSSPKDSIVAPKSKGQIQRELLDLKRRSLAHRRKGETEEAEELLRRAKVLECQMEEIDASKNESPSELSNSGKLEKINTINGPETHGNLKSRIEADDGLNVAEKFSSNRIVESSIGIKDTTHIIRKPDNLIPIDAEIVKIKQPCRDDHDLAGQHGHSANVPDILMQDPANKVEDTSGSGHPSQASSSVQQIVLPKNEGSGVIDSARTKRAEDADKGVQAFQTHSARVSSQDSSTSLQQEILAHKKKAVALKGEGKLAEAKEELRRAKQLDKSLEEVSSQPQRSTASESTSVPPSDHKHGSPNSAPKPLTSRERFKLQQESLSHKRQAMKLRREGRMEEAEAEFELAKALETQLESSSNDSMKSSNSEVERVDDVVVEDFLDPQLLSALRAIGLDDSKPESTKPINVSNSSSSQERHELEEQIKAERVKALRFKRSGKQSEALGALRRAKALEKRMNSLPQ